MQVKLNFKAPLNPYFLNTLLCVFYFLTVSILIIDEDGEVLFETGTEELAKEYDVTPTPADLVEAIKDELNGRFYTQEKSPN